MASQKQQADLLSAAEASLRQLLQQHFGDAQDVEAIFLAKRSDHWYIRVITDHEKYSSDAMDSLFEREDKVRDALDGILLDFDYIPRLESALGSLMPHRAFVIFQKQL